MTRKKRWGFITPCVNTRAEVEKLLGKPLTSNEDSRLPTYDYKNEKISVFYSTERTDSRICDNQTAIDTVILFSVIPIRDLKLSELKIDPAKFKKDERNRGREFTYTNQEEGIIIETELVEFSDKKPVEMVASIQFGKNFKNRRSVK